MVDDELELTNRRAGSAQLTLSTPRLVPANEVQLELTVATRTLGPRLAVTINGEAG